MMSLIVDRLRNAAPSLLSVDMAQDLDAIFAGTAPQTGAVYVVPYREKGKPNTLMTGGFMQVIPTQFLVAFVMRVHADPTGAVRAAQFDAVTDAIEAALAGWEPTEDSEPVSFVGGEGTPLSNNVTLYVQTWETTRLLTGA